MGFVDVIHAADQARPFYWPTLPTVSGDSVALMHKCSRQPRTWTLAYGDRTLRLSGPLDMQINALPIRCVVRFGHVSLTIRTDREALGTLFRIRGVSDDAATLSPRTAALVLEALICDLVAPLGALLGSPFEIVEYGPSDAEEPGSFVGISVQSGSADLVPLAIFGPMTDLHTIADAIGDRGHPKRARMPHEVTFTARLFGPEFQITADQLSGLVPGSGVILEQRWDERRGGWIAIQDHLFATVNHHEDGIKMSSPLTKTTAGTPSSPPPQSASAQQTESLPVTIGVQLAERTIQLSEIQALSSGAVIKLEDTITTDVTLLANGVHFAAAELVELDGKVAVKIKQIG